MGLPHALALLAAALGISSEAPTPQPSELLVEVRPVGEGSLKALDVVAIPESGESERVSGSITPPQSATNLPLPPGVWWIRISSPSYWAEAKRVVWPEGGDTVQLSAWPGTSVVGHLKVPRGEVVPTEIKVRFTAAPEARARLTGIDRCRVEEARFSCTLPAIPLDLRLRAEPFMTQYRWGLRMPADEPTDLGTLRLRRGASLVGWVVTHDGSPLPDGQEVHLVEAGLASPLAEAAEEVAAASRSAAVNSRGFFHFDGLSPGEYAVSLEVDGLGAASQIARVLDDLEAELEEPLLLAPPETLSAEVRPPTQPDGSPWRAELRQTDSRRLRSATVAAVEVPADGFLQIPGLPRGDYRLSIRTRDGESWLHRQVAVGEDPMPLTLEMDLLRIEGRVTLGDDPLEASVIFGTRIGVEEAEFRSDEEGHFAGLLPHDGTWPVEVIAEEPKLHVVREIEIETRDDGEPIEVRLELPDTTLRARVVTALGAPADRAFVEILGPGRPTPFSGVTERTDSDGKIELQGFAEGVYQLRARFRDLESSFLPVALVDGLEAAEITLTLFGQREIQGKVLSTDGPVAGAQIVMMPLDLTAAGSVLTSGPGGRFTTTMRRDVEEVRFFAEAPGYAFRMGTARLPQDGRLEIELQLDRGNALELEIPVGEAAGDHYPVLLHHGTSLGYSGLAQRASSVEIVNGAEQFVLPGFEPGGYQLCWRRITSAPEGCTQGTLPISGSLALKLEAPPNSQQP